MSTYTSILAGSSSHLVFMTSQQVGLDDSLLILAEGRGGEKRLPGSGALY